MCVSLSEVHYPELSALGAALEAMAVAAPSREAYVQQVCDRLYREVVERDGQPSSLLVRCFLVLHRRTLPADLASLAERLAGEPLGPAVPCLTLLGTAGAEPAWNDRRQSVNHQVLPLQSPAALDRIPMVRQLLAQLQLEILHTDPTVPVVHIGDDRRNDRLFYVPEAYGCPHIPTQDTFIRPYGIAAILGFGDILAAGEAFAVLLFGRVALDPVSVQAFRILTLHVRHGLERLRDRPVFEG